MIYGSMLMQMPMPKTFGVRQDLPTCNKARQCVIIIASDQMALMLKGTDCIFGFAFGLIVSLDLHLELFPLLDYSPTLGTFSLDLLRLAIDLYFCT